MTPERPRATALALLLPFLPPALRAQEPIPTPVSVLGFEPGADGKLARWEQVTNYFAALDRASDRVSVRELGKTTDGKPFLLATITSRKNQARLDELRAIQKRIADPRGLTPEEERRCLGQGRAILYVSLSIHSSEVGASLFGTSFAYELATRDDEEMRRILDEVIVLLVPCTNPDGMDLIHDWYRETEGTPYDGSAMPWLYQRYAGHDNNRDWFMLNLAETRLCTKVLYGEWFPQVVWDAHQMGQKGARIFVPPYANPVNGNLDPLLTQAINLVGTRLAHDLCAADMTGVVQGVDFDNWWNGGNRNVPFRHNMIGILTEVASANLATPVFLKPADLAGHRTGLPSYQAQENFNPWPGGWWRLADIVRYERECGLSLLRQMAAERETYLRRQILLGRRAIERGRKEPPFAFVIPEPQRDPGSADQLVALLLDTAVEVHTAREPFVAAGRSCAAGSRVVLMEQPFRAHAKDCLERQAYPELLETVGGKVIPPYDVAGWTLPLQMGVECLAASEPFAAKLDRIDSVGVRPVLGAGAESWPWIWPCAENRSFRFVNEALAAGKVVSRAGASGDFREGDAGDGWRRRRPVRLGLYQPWTASMDEGWTRLVLERHGFAYEAVRNERIRAGRLESSFDVLVFPDQTAKSILEGREVGSVAPRYAAGIGEEGAGALRSFLEEGGRIVLLDSACELAFERLGVEGRVVPMDKEKFSCPGSILEVVTSHHTLTAGCPRSLPVFFESSPVLEVDAKWVAARYPNRDPLLSGYLRGGVALEGKVALASVPVGKGSVALIGFRCQHRGQSTGTFKVLFNAILGE